MNRRELVEAADALRRCCASLADAAKTRTAELSAAIGVVDVEADDLVEDGRVGADLGKCFAFASAAGLDEKAIASVRNTAQAMPATARATQAIVQAVLRHCLVADARLIAATNFVSREDVDAVRVRVTAAFDAAADYAADINDQPAYRAIVGLHAAVVRDLTARSRPLPRMARYSFGVSAPSLALANRLYGDATRADELQAENRTPHPLFMPREIRALTA